ncbi:MAG: hypothetical protein ACI80F_001343 [Natronomonas sp.]
MREPVLLNSSIGESTSLREVPLQESADDPFDDCELDPDAILGIHTYEEVLFTAETETPVNVVTGETPAHSQATVEEASEFAASIDTDTPQIALPASVETQSNPYTSAAFFQFKATGSLERHRAYHAASGSDAFTVDFEADYESESLTTTVDRADEEIMRDKDLARHAFHQIGAYDGPTIFLEIAPR